MADKKEPKISTAIDIRFSQKKKCFYMVKVKYTKDDIIEKEPIGDTRIRAVFEGKRLIVEKVLNINLDEVKPEDTSS